MLEIFKERTFVMRCHDAKGRLSYRETVCFCARPTSREFKKLFSHAYEYVRDYIRGDAWADFFFNGEWIFRITFKEHFGMFDSSVWFNTEFETRRGNYDYRRLTLAT